MEKEKVIVYVDGYNFYYGLKNGGAKWKRHYWLDMVKFFERMMLPDQELVEVNYYSAVPLDDQQAADNQDVLFSANLVNPKFKLHLGRYKKKKFKCQNCGFKNKTYEEKESDVRVATGMLVDLFTKRCDITIVVSADSDMIPSVEIIKGLLLSIPFMFSYRLRRRRMPSPASVTMWFGSNIIRQDSCNHHYLMRLFFPMVIN